MACTGAVSSTKRPCFIEEDDGLASLADMEAGFSGYASKNAFFTRSVPYSSRLSSLRSLAASSASYSPRSVRFYDARFEDQPPYFLDSCFLCKKPLSDNKDIFMYRGDVPFCSVECRQEQIDMDEAMEKKSWNRSSSSMKALRNKEQRQSSSPNKAQDYSFRTSTVAAA